VKTPYSEIYKLEKLWLKVLIGVSKTRVIDR